MLSRGETLELWTCSLGRVIPFDACAIHICDISLMSFVLGEGVLPGRVGMVMKTALLSQPLTLMSNRSSPNFPFREELKLNTR